MNRMSLSALNWVTPYHQLFPNNPLFPINLKVFGCICFVWDVRSGVSKLDPKSLKCIFVVFKKGIGVIVPLFDVTLCLLILHSLRIPRFPFRLLLQVLGRMMIYWFIMFPYRFLIQLPFLLNLLLLKYTLDAKTPKSRVQHQLLRP